MDFDFQRFSKIAASVYNDGSLYSLDQCLEIFRAYFLCYEEHMGHPHPPIRAVQIAEIMQSMPWVCEADKGSWYAVFPPDDYKAIIDLHFKTKYRHCDYGINHFFSGKIRELRTYEADAGYE